jgi:RNA recognition motif-containing protein
MSDEQEYQRSETEGSPSHEFKQQLMNPKVAGPITLNKFGQTPVVIKPNVGQIDLKLFVGQIPKDWTELEVTKFFSNYGTILESQIIKDSKTGQSKGCAFVKFASMTKAEECIKQIQAKPFHLPGVQNVIQIKWADGEEQRLGLSGIDPNMATKLFVGSILKEATEENLRDVFEQFGIIDELVLMKENGVSKGCAFIKFRQKEDALLAIRALNAQAYILNSDKPIEVRFAENKKKHPTPTQPPTGNTPNYPYQMGGGQGQMGMNQPQPYPNYMYPGQGGAPATYYKYLSPEGHPYYYSPVTNKTQWEEPPLGSIVIPEPDLNNPYTKQYTQQTNTTKGYSQQSNNNNNNSSAASATGSDGAPKRQGPSGSNLFIFHLPNEWKENDLIEFFKEFGTIISARIMTDRTTGRSRGFGFVSYDNPNSAKNAITKMNGLQVGSKRLKVQLKKGDDDDVSVLSSTNKYQPY